MTPALHTFKQGHTPFTACAPGCMDALTLAAIAIFVNEVKGEIALAMSGHLGLSYKTSFILCHKMRENALGAKKSVGFTGLAAAREGVTTTFRLDRSGERFWKALARDAVLERADVVGISSIKRPLLIAARRSCRG